MSTPYPPTDPQQQAAPASPIDDAALSGFDALVFAAGNDIRHLPPGTDEAAHWQRANAEGVPAFFRRARHAGIPRAVHIGSFYPQAAPHLVSKSAYVRGRMLADDGVRLPGYRRRDLAAKATVAGVEIPPALAEQLARLAQ